MEGCSGTSKASDMITQVIIFTKFVVITCIFFKKIFCLMIVTMLPHEIKTDNSQNML